MKKTVLLFYICCFISCNHTNKQQSLSQNQTETTPFAGTFTTYASPKDTLLMISSDWAILFRSYSEELKLWYEPYIVDFNKKDTVKIKDYFYGNGSYADVSRVSPNLKYLILDNITAGYIETGEERILYDNYHCVIIDIENASVVWSGQSDCDGEWDNENRWINPDGEVIFSHSQ